MRYLLLVTLVFFFNACSVKNYENTNAKIIIIKSPKLKFGDLGYIRNTQKAIELELFVAGNPVEKFTINHLICVSEGCMGKSSFNKTYLHHSYPEDILQNILLGKEIYNGENKLITDDGFHQKISNKDVEITYRVSSKIIYFKDRQNRILLKIKETK